jgi:hypothetical protein
MEPKMNLVQEMKERLAGRQSQDDDPGRQAEIEHQAKIENDQLWQEKRAAAANAVRLKKLNGGLEIPPLPERPAELVELAARRTQLANDREAIEDELRQIEEKIEQKNDADRLDDAAERIAKGEAEIDAPNIVPEEVTALRKRLDLARLAEGKLANLLAEGHARHARAIAKALRPLHRAAVQRIHAALLELEAANAEESAIRSEVPGAPLQFCGFPQLGTRGPNGGGPLWHWIAFARRHGMLDEAE